MPALEARQERFVEVHTQPLGISVDSRHCHAAWAQSLGGVSFPLLADFHPKGQVAQSLGVYLPDRGTTDRATVIVDAEGVVRHVSSVTPAGKRDMDELLELCRRIDADYPGKLAPPPAPEGIAPGTELFVRDSCAASRAALAACENLHLELPIRNVSRDEAALRALEERTGKRQAPCLVMPDGPLLESREITRLLASLTRPC